MKSSPESPSIGTSDIAISRDGTKIGCLVLADCTGSYFPEFHEAALSMISAQDGIVGWVGESASVITSLQAA